MLINRRDLLRAAFGSALLLALSACGDDDDEAEAVGSDVERDPADPEAARSFAAAQNAFTWDLYFQLAPTAGNIFFSPFSIATALAQVTAGARGDTAAQLHQALHTESLGDGTWNGAGSLELLLEEAATGDDTFRLNVANSAWAQEGFTFEKAYLDALARYFGSEINVIDFKEDPDAARTTINDWVSEKTEEMIPELLPGGSVTNLTRLVLANAIYFNARWETEFHPSETNEGEFTLDDGSTTVAQFMSRRGDIGVAEQDGFTAAELPYKGGRFSMMIILPPEFGPAGTAPAISQEIVDRLVAGMEAGDTQLAIPKFAFEYGQSLKDSLKALGIEALFDPDQADLSGIAPPDDLHVSDVFHKAIVRTDERGTEASAATGIIAGVTSMPRMFRADRTFIFLIRDGETGAIVFAGRLSEPVFDV